MAQHDYIISNQTFPNTRADINNLASAIATNNSGTSAPTTQYAGQFWIDTTTTTWTLYIHDGTDDIQFATIDTSANTVNFIDSALDVVTDTTPQLGGDLDLNSNDITGTGNINITGNATVSGDLTVDTDTLYVNSSNNRVGIGTSSPSTPLTLDIGTNNVGLFQNSTDATSGFSLADNGGSINLATTSSGAFRVLVGGDANTSADNSSEAMRIDNSGNVGIGTTSPSQKLHIEGNLLVDAYNNAGEGGGIFLREGFETTAQPSITLKDHSGSAPDGISINGSDGVSFRTADTERMRIDGSGNVGIGTTSPEYKFHVEVNDSGGFAGTLRNTNVNGYILELDYPDNSPDNNSVAFLVARDSTTNRFIVQSDGDVVNHDNSYGSISDEKLKEQITDASSQWNDIKDLRIRKFKFKSDVSEKGDSDELWRLGLVAQEAELVAPNLIKESPDLDDNNQDLGTTTKSIKYSILYMKAVKALQEAMQKIEDLEARVDTLEGN